MTDLSLYEISIEGLRNAPSIKPSSVLDLALIDQQQRLLIAVSAS
jgi:hypothetical protein